MQSEIALSMHGITKAFSGVRALDEVTFSLAYGELHALVGENGAGKSTLMKILSGVYPASSYFGEVRVFEEVCGFSRPRDAEKKGIAIIQQELMVLDELSIAENILLGHLSKKNGLVDWKAVRVRAEEAVRAVGLEIDVRTLVTEVERYAIHDGEGIRTTVFPKGCPLRCRWCCNPETQVFESERGFFADRCSGCDACAVCTKTCGGYIVMCLHTRLCL